MVSKVSTNILESHEDDDRTYAFNFENELLDGEVLTSVVDVIEVDENGDDRGSEAELTIGAGSVLSADTVVPATGKTLAANKVALVRISGGTVPTGEKSKMYYVKCIARYTGNLDVARVGRLKKVKI